MPYRMPSVDIGTIGSGGVMKKNERVSRQNISSRHAFVSRQIYDFPPKSWHPKIQNPPPPTTTIKSVAAAEPPTPSRSRASTYPLPPLAQPSTIDPLSDHGSRRHRCRCCCHQWRHSARSLFLLLHHFCCLGACLVAPLEI